MNERPLAMANPDQNLLDDTVRNEWVTACCATNGSQHVGQRMGHSMLG